MSVFLSVGEVANLLGVSKQAIQKNCKAEKYTTRQVTAKGGKDGLKYEIALSSLPESAQIRYQNERLKAIAIAIEQPELLTEKKAIEPVNKAVDLLDCTDRQREIERSRAAVVLFVQSFGKPVSKALQALNERYAAGTLPDNVVRALEKSIEKGVFKKLERSTYHNWLLIKHRSGYYAPLKRDADNRMKWWHEPLLALYRRPQQPTLQSCVEVLVVLAEKQAAVPPSYRQVDYFLKEKLSQYDLQTGRNTGMALRAKRYHKTRSAAGLMPWDVVHADGWATHFTAPHPLTGDYVTLEVWDAHDVATRFVPPLAVGFTENHEVIAKCFENALRHGGAMAMMLTDSTKIVKNNPRFVGDPLLSLSEIAGIEIIHPKTVGNAQANGISENFHTYLDREARELATYQHERADSLSFRRTKKSTADLVKAKAAGDDQAVVKARKDIARNSKGYLFESFDEAVAWLEAKRVKFNDRPHSALKKVLDNATGKKVHQSPQQAFGEALAAGWKPIALDDHHLADLFIPRVRCRVYRGVVKPYSSKVGFVHTDLRDYEGQKVLVAYDMMNSQEVTVMDLKGALICTAHYDAPVGYVAQNALDAAREKRAVAQIRRREKQIVGIKERAGLKVIDSSARSVIELKTVDFTRVEEPVVALKRVEYDLVDDDAKTPKLRTLADMLAEASDDNAPEPVAPVPYVWGDCDDEDDVVLESKP